MVWVRTARAPSCPYCHHWPVSSAWNPQCVQGADGGDGEGMCLQAGMWGSGLLWGRDAGTPPRLAPPAVVPPHVLLLSRATSSTQPGHLSRCGLLPCPSLCHGEFPGTANLCQGLD